MAFAAANFADFAIQGTPSARFTVVLTAILVTVTGLCYALALRPRVITSATGITVVNPFRVHRIPWAAVQAVDTGDWVRVHCAPGSARARIVYCWALYVSARTKRRSGRTAPAPRPAGPFRTPAWLAEKPVLAGQHRLPDEARALAALPVSKAIAARLDSRAARERGRLSADGTVGRTSAWSWPALAAVAAPAVLLLVVALA